MRGSRTHLVEHWGARRTACGRGSFTVEYRTPHLDRVSCITCQGTHLYFDLRKAEGTVKLRDGSHQGVLADA